MPEELPHVFTPRRSLDILQRKGSSIDFMGREVPRTPEGRQCRKSFRCVESPMPPTTPTRRRQHLQESSRTNPKLCLVADSDIDDKCSAVVKTPKTEGKKSMCCGQSLLGTPKTPQAKHPNLQDTPPMMAHPCQRSTQRDDIDEALLHSSVPLLSLALLHGHRCSENHLVYEAVRLQHFPAVEFLLWKGFPPDELCCGLRPLDLAIQCCMVEGDVGQRMADLLLKYGAKPNANPSDGMMQVSPMHTAAQRSCEAAMSVLLLNGADPNHVDALDFTPLHLACRQRNYDPGVSPMTMPFPTSFQEHVIELLLRHGANPSLRDAAGFTPSMFLSKNDVRLSSKLARAERWFIRYGLKILCANHVLDRMPDNNPCIACLSQPGISDTITNFL